MKKQWVLISIFLVMVAFIIAGIDYNESKEKRKGEESAVIYTEENAIGEAAEVFRTENGHKYHCDNCSYLYNSKIAITLSEAKEMGLEPCSVCEPPQ